MLGPPELALILVLGILFFGYQKLPKLGHSLGEATVEHRRGREQSEQELEELREQNQ